MGPGRVEKLGQVRGAARGQGLSQLAQQEGGHRQGHLPARLPDLSKHASFILRVTYSGGQAPYVRRGARSRALPNQLPLLHIQPGCYNQGAPAQPLRQILCSVERGGRGAGRGGCEQLWASSLSSGLAALLWSAEPPPVGMSWTFRWVRPCAGHLEALVLTPCLCDFPAGPGGPAPVLPQGPSGSLAGELALELEMLAACPELEAVSPVPLGAVHQEATQREAISVLALR